MKEVDQLYPKNLAGQTKPVCLISGGGMVFPVEDKAHVVVACLSNKLATRFHLDNYSPLEQSSCAHKEGAQLSEQTLIPALERVAKRAGVLLVNETPGKVLPTANLCGPAVSESVSLTIDCSPTWSKSEELEAASKVATIQRLIAEQQALGSNGTVPRLFSTRSDAVGGVSACVNNLRDEQNAAAAQPPFAGFAPLINIDHRLELQLGGSDEQDNLMPLSASLNKSIGRLIAHALATARVNGILPLGTRIASLRLRCRDFLYPPLSTSAPLKFSRDGVLSIVADVLMEIPTHGPHAQRALT